MHPELRFQANLALKHGYKKLDSELSKWVRKRYLENLPIGFSLNGDEKIKIYSNSETLIANGYNRIVIGDYGAFIEMSDFQVVTDNLIVKRGQEYRMQEKYEGVKYYWLTAKDNSDIKIYLQKKGVSYADYLPEKYYVSPFEVVQMG